MSKELETRIALLERRLARVETKWMRANPAWVKHAGWAENDPLYDEAMRLGAQWRKRQNRKPRRNAGHR